MPWLPLKIPHPHSITLISKTSLSLYRQYMVFFSKKKSILRSCFHQEKQTKTIRWINCACTYYRIMSICALMYKHKQSWCSLLYWNVFIPCLLQSIRALLVCTWACVPGTPIRSHSRVAIQTSLWMSRFQLCQPTENLFSFLLGLLLKGKFYTNSSGS